MDKTLTLPPLVRGNVTGFLDFFIDEITLFRNILFLTEKFDIVGQVQWWGEISPAYIRPQQLHVPQNKKSLGLLKTYIHSARYVIKTTMDLLKVYLKACEVVEVSVLEAVENYIIGSAFLKDLTNLLGNSNFFILPIYNYMGEEIGKIKIHVTVSENIQRVGNTKYFLGKTIHTNQKCFTRTPTNVDRVGVCNKTSSETLSKDLDSEINESKTCLPEIETIGDSSKVLYFDLSLSNRLKTDKKCFKQAKKINKNSITSRLKIQKKVESKGNGDVHVTKKKTELVNTLKKAPATKPNSITKEKQTRENFSSEQIPSKESSDTKVFDYLFGSEMSKEEEEIALKNFTKMSPSHSIVTSINQLCLSADLSEPDKEKRINHLNFDLSNPIEKNYYEKFFLKSNSNDFEVAEFLNKPENNNFKEKLKEIDYAKGDSAINPSESQQSSNSGENNFSYGVNERNSGNCNRCKYYKKLDELDTIIESLRHFEKIIAQEKTPGELVSLINKS